MRREAARLHGRNKQRVLLSLQMEAGERVLGLV